MCMELHTDILLRVFSFVKQTNKKTRNTSAWDHILVRLKSLLTNALFSSLGASGSFLLQGRVTSLSPPRSLEGKRQTEHQARVRVAEWPAGSPSPRRPPFASTGKAWPPREAAAGREATARPPWRSLWPFPPGRPLCSAAARAGAGGWRGRAAA